MSLIVHGGAGGRRPSLKALKRLAESAVAGHDILRAGGLAVEAVVRAVEILENSGLFNAGSGANLQYDGVRRLDASVMDGSTLKAGAVVGLEGTRNPVRAARVLMDFPHVMMTNAGAAKVAAACYLESLPEPDERATRKLQRAMLREPAKVGLYRNYFSTVGAVAYDKDGDFAAAASTGGIMGMLPGRVGDTPVIGAGIYAENPCAVACTGLGEYIIRLSLAKEICMNIRTMQAVQAVRLSLRRLLRLGGEGGVIVIDKEGLPVIMHTTRYMAAAYANRRGLSEVREAFRRISV